MSKSDWRRTIFTFIVLVYLGFLLFINVMMFLPDNWISAVGHFSFIGAGNTHDLIHEIVFALIVGTAAIGLFSQLWTPKKNFAGQLVALITWGIMILLAVLTNNFVPQPLFLIFGGLTILATFFHPAGTGLFKWVRTAKANKILLILVIIATIPLLWLALTNIKLQMAGDGGGFFDHNPPAFHNDNIVTENSNEIPNDDEASHVQKHSDLGHYRNIAALSLIISLLGLWTSFMPSGWRISAWITGSISIILGSASIFLPDAESSLGAWWGFAAVILGIVFIAVIEFSQRK